VWLGSNCDRFSVKEALATDFVPPTNRQRIANESPEPNANKRRQSSPDLAGFMGVSRE
jgi:hypothetical protein